MSVGLCVHIYKVYVFGGSSDDYPLATFESFDLDSGRDRKKRKDIFIYKVKNIILGPTFESFDLDSGRDRKKKDTFIYKRKNIILGSTFESFDLDSGRQTGP